MFKLFPDDIFPYILNQLFPIFMLLGGTWSSLTAFKMSNSANIDFFFSNYFTGL